MMPKLFLKPLRVPFDRGDDPQGNRLEICFGFSESFRNKIIKLYEDLILDKYPNVFVLEGSVENRYNKMVEIMYHE